MADVRQGDNQVQGDVADNGVDVGFPIKIGGKANAAAPSAVGENDRVNASFDLQGQLRTIGVAPALQDVGGDVAHDAPDAGDPIKIGGKAYSTLPSAVANTDRVDGVWTTQGALTVAGVDGTTPRAVAVNASGQLEVDISAQQLSPIVISGTVTADAGTGTMNVDITAQTVGALSVDLGSNNDVTVDGSVAHDAVDSGGLGPVKIGGRAQEPTAQPDEVADEDRVDALYDRNGYQRMRGDFDVASAVINDAVSGDNTIVAAQTAGKRIAVWSMFVVSDGTVDVRFEDGVAGAFLTGQIPLQTREGFTHAAGGMVPLWIGSAATLLNLELSAAVNVHGHLSYSVVDD